MSDPENPLGLSGFEFLEFATHTPKEADELVGLFTGLGFEPAARHRSKDVTLYRQGGINFILNREKDCFAYSFALVHGPSVCAMGFRVADARAALARALAHGEKQHESRIGPGELAIPAIRGLHGSLIYLVDRHGAKGSIYEVDFRSSPAASHEQHLIAVDHVSHVVMPGHMETWAHFYHDIFGFREEPAYRIADASGTVLSKVVTSPDGNIRIPINEPTSAGTVTEQFIHDYFGEGIQHIALRTDDLAATVDEAMARGVQLLPIPGSYYDDLRKKGGLSSELIDQLQDRDMLIDFDETGGLLQAYTQPVAGTIFFELLERRDHTGFGHRNTSTRLSALQALRTKS